MKPISERLVEEINDYYTKQNVAKIKKIDARIRIAKGQVIYGSSVGLDYGGLLWGGKHIEFEVKETSKGTLPISNIRISQIDRIEKLQEMGSETFMLVFFSQPNEWYKIYIPELRPALEYNSVPVEFFRGFGSVVPLIGNGTGTLPDYLYSVKSARYHPERSVCRSLFPSYMPKKSEVKIVSGNIPEDRINYKDKAVMKDRIRMAINRGCTNAKDKEKFKARFQYNSKKNTE